MELGLVEDNPFNNVSPHGAVSLLALGLVCIKLRC